MPKPSLSEEEQAFVDGPVEELCEMLDDWKINRELKDLPPDVWKFILEKTFPGSCLIISAPVAAALEFSALGQWRPLVTKISHPQPDRCRQRDGTHLTRSRRTADAFRPEQQKEHYLPRPGAGAKIFPALP